jgi:hypothetical protein
LQTSNAQHRHSHCRKTAEAGPKLGEQSITVNGIVRNKLTAPAQVPVQEEHCMKEVAQRSALKTSTTVSYGPVTVINPFK